MILVTGGAGYIGSHTIKHLLKRGYDVVALDNLSEGHREMVMCEEFVEADLRNLRALRQTFRQYPIDAVMHFAALTRVGESVEDPQKYYENNVTGSLNLLHATVESQVKHLIFSSSAAVYGDPIEIPMPEDHPKNPKNPYGKTKWIIEQILEDYASAYGLRCISLRYFNAAGSDLEGEIGELHNPETHLIPIVLDVALGRRDHIEIFGTDYDTPDGTCIRDYIHVDDIADAHIRALERLHELRESGVYNCGYGHGYSVREVVDTVKKVTGVDFPVEEAGRREGDAPVLVADNAGIRRELGWEPRHDDLEYIIRTAWNWEKKL